MVWINLLDATIRVPTSSRPLTNVMQKSSDFNKPLFPLIKSFELLKAEQFVNDLLGMDIDSVLVHAVRRRKAYQF